jgi:hypothetical protein
MTTSNGLFRPRALIALVLPLAVLAFSTADAAPVVYEATLNGASEQPPNASPAEGFAIVTIDAVAHTMHLHVEFELLLAPTTQAHIHAATAVPGLGTAGVATPIPAFPGFPLGVASGIFDNTMNMTLAASYNPSYLTAHGGTTAQAEADLFQAIADGKAYLNIHTTAYTGGEIRGFLTPQPVPTAESTWGKIKSLYR